MRKILKYKVVQEMNAEKVTEKVEIEMELGCWQPFGSLAVYEHWCYQPIVIYEAKNEA